jgi:hypothetical protein
MTTYLSIGNPPEIVFESRIRILAAQENGYEFPNIVREDEK